jgi:hypothetical protein
LLNFAEEPPGLEWDGKLLRKQRVKGLGSEIEDLDGKRGVENFE